MLAQVKEAAMEWKTIVVGVDGSPEAVHAAEVGCELARRTSAHCRLVHAAPDYWSAVTAPELGLDVQELDRGTVEHARALVDASMRGRVPDPLLAGMEIQVGRPPAILSSVAERDHADLIVLGGKHHRGLDRVTTSTIVHMVRLHDVPVLATTSGLPPVKRVLAAVDLSYAARPVIAMAEQWAALFGAQLRVLSVVEPMPVVPGVALKIGDEEVYHAAEQLLDLQVWPAITRSDAETVVRRGRAAAAIADEAAQWQADLLVLGSHGKGWASRLLIGSTSERLLHLLPVSMLVVPVGKPERERILAGTELPWDVRTVAPATAGA
jgi:nucleotide-binding universal stress UspA family protein